MVRASLPFLTFFLLLPLVPADDANWSKFGGAGAFAPNRQIRMEHEDVRIWLDDDTVRVHATFWFRNRGPATTVRMGFPDETADHRDSSKSHILHFRSSVDGRKVKVSHQKLTPGFDKRIGINSYRSAWVKSVSFVRNGARKVEIWYDAEHGFEGSGYSSDTYVFKTGATWRGTIGRIETTVDWRKTRERSRPALRLTGPARGRRWTEVGYRRAKLVVDNVEPRFDLDLATIDSFWNFRLNGRPLAQTLALDDSGSTIAGPPEDLRISANHIGTVFEEAYVKGSASVEDTIWTAPEAKRFGRRLTFLGTQTLVTATGRKLLLAHAATDRLGNPFTAKMRKDEEPPYVKLRDVIRVLGGSYRFDPRLERVDLRLPPSELETHE